MTDIVEQLRCQFDDCDGTCVPVVAANEIVRLRAVLDAERALADQLAEALRAAVNVWGVQAHVRSSVHPVATAALAAYEEARRG